MQCVPGCRCYAFVRAGLRAVDAVRCGDLPCYVSWGHAAEATHDFYQLPDCLALSGQDGCWWRGCYRYRLQHYCVRILWLWLPGCLR